MANNEDSDLIEAALNEAIKTSPDHEEGDILVEWVIVGYVTNPDNKKGDQFPMYFSNGLIPTHHARGLLTTGLMQLGIVEEEED